MKNLIVFAVFAVTSLTQIQAAFADQCTSNDSRYSYKNGKSNCCILETASNIRTSFSTRKRCEAESNTEKYILVGLWSAPSGKSTSPGGTSSVGTGTAAASNLASSGSGGISANLNSSISNPPRSPGTTFNSSTSGNQNRNSNSIGGNSNSVPPTSNNTNRTTHVQSGTSVTGHLGSTSPTNQPVHVVTDNQSRANMQRQLSELDGMSNQQKANSANNRSRADTGANGDANNRAKRDTTKTNADAEASWKAETGEGAVAGNGSNKLSAVHTGDYASGNYTEGRGKAEDTEIVNMTAEATKSRVTDISSAIISNAGSQAQANLQKKGASATQKEFVQAETGIARKNANALLGAGSVKMAVGGIQAWRAADHAKAAKSLEAKNISEQNENHRAYIQAIKSGDSAAAQTALQDEARRKENYRAEKSRQKSLAMQEGMVAGATMAEAANDYMQAALIKKAANAVDALAENTGGGNYGFNSGSVGNENVPPPNTDAIQTDGAVVTDAGNNDKSPFADESDPFAPENLDPGADGAPPANAFNNSAPGTPGGAGGGPGMGGAGGTSKASGDGDGKNQETASKSQAGGTYGSEGGYRSKSGGSGSGAGVGTDSSFLDMLKGLLPGNGKEETAKADLSLDDRNPASESAAVLPRNANIFDAISKRYDKKSKDGSVSI